MGFIYSWVLSFLANNWMWVLIGLVVVGIAIRIFYYASNPLAVLTDFLGFMQKHWRLVLIGACVLGGTLYVLNLKNTITVQQEQLVVAEKNVKKLTESNAKLEQTIEYSNKLISQFEKVNTETKKQFETLNTNVQANNRKLTQQLQTIAKDKKPQTCEEAVRYLITAQKEYSK